MRTAKLFILLMILGLNLNAQSDFDISINSKILETERKIKIHLPKSYENSDDKTYPLILVLDSENTFYFTVGNTEIMYDPDPDFELIPEAIVVGIYQNYSMDETTYNLIRGKDAMWNENTGMFSKNSKLFSGFVTEEVLPYLKSNYKIGEFKAILGWSLTASFISSMLLENDHHFDAYILLSPNWVNFNQSIFDHIEKGIDKKFVYVSTSEYDLQGHRKSITELQLKYFSKQTFKNVEYLYNDFKGEHHTSLVNRSMPYAVKHIFSLYKPVNQIDLQAFMISSDKMKFLEEVYKSSNSFYGTKRTFTDLDFEEFADLAIEEKNWQALKEISKINIKIFPKLQTGYFYRAVYEENYNKDLKTALKYYKLSYQNIAKGIREDGKAYWLDDIKRVEKLLSEN